MSRSPIPILLLLVGIQLRAAPAMPDAVSTVLQRHCFKCHGSEKQKGDIRLDNLATDFVNERAAAETWHETMNVVQLGEMPPDDEAGLSREERQTLVGWIRNNLNQAFAAGKGTRQGVVMRRLNKVEYRYALMDLLKIDGDFGSELPAEPQSRDGFINNGNALGMSGMQLETYLRSARAALRKVLREGDAPEPQRYAATEPDKLRNLLPGHSTNRLGRYHYFGIGIPDAPRSGPFAIRVTAKAEPVPDHVAPFLQVRYGYQVAGAKPLMKVVGEARITDTNAHTFEFRGWVDSFPLVPGSGDKMQQLLTVQNSLDDGIEPAKPIKAKRRETIYPDDPHFPKVVIESVELRAGDHPTWPPETHRRILFPAADETSPEYAREVLSRFMRRAWRRPPEKRELAAYLRRFEALLAETESRIAAFREILAVVLTSPNFLYLVEPPPQDGSPGLTHHEIAARLACFLWCSLPDESLLRLADQQRMKAPAVLRQQVARMLEDGKSERFIQQFATQWLDLEGVNRVAVNPEFHPRFDPRLEPLMTRESQLFFREILRQNLSVLTLLDADFTMANAALARHYGLTGPRSQQFERVALAGRRPGGLLGHAAMLLANSTGADSHPIKRAVWIRERLLDDPPAPPPPNVPALDPSNPDFARLSIPEQLRVHREDPACGDCHRGIDPWGLALENFDAVGQWREEIRRPSGKRGKRAKFDLIPVAADTTLPDGSTINGIAGLKQHLLNKRRHQFARAFVTKLATYALGRSMELSDEPELEELTARFTESGYRIPYLIAEIAAGKMFRSR